MSARKNKTKFKFWPFDEAVFWKFDWFLHADMEKKDILKLDYSLVDDSKLESLGLWWLKRVVRTYMHKDSFD